MGCNMIELSRIENTCKNLWKMYGSTVEEEFLNHGCYTNDDLVKEFFFVILGGFGISYELNRSALDVFNRNGLINRDLYKSEVKLQETTLQIKDELSKPQFEPRTKLGEYRKYRYIETKPWIVASGGYWLWSECEWNLEKKVNKLSAIEIRQWMCNCPGFGMKSASWFIRNTGISDDCAVFDVHVIRFLKQLGVAIPETLTNKIYIQIEDLLRNICRKIDVSLGKLDYLLWMLGKNGFLAYVR